MSRIAAGLQAMENQETFFSVRGRSKSQKMIRAMTPQTMLQVAWLVILLKQMVQVRMWLAMLKIKKMVCAAPPNSLPTRGRPRGLKRTSNASAMLCTYADTDSAIASWHSSCSLAYPGIRFFELPNDIARVCCDDTESEDEKKSRDQPDGGQHRGQ